MLLIRGFLLLLLVLMVMVPQADARRRSVLKRQNDHGHDHHRHDTRRELRLRRRRIRHATLPTPVRHTESSEGIPVGEAVDDPQCPPPMKPFEREMCSAPACLHHHQCSQGRACCFNGCLHTCLLQVDSPPVIDWLEDTGSILPILEESAPPKLPVRYEDLSFAEGRGEAVHLPGGCTISGSQYSQLQNFMKAPSIENCMCNQGEVVCAVKMFKS
ncbi:uncharacterized protein LOC121862343 [Homarus americanus]|uniref:uncharacterized protein LOC121862343 n=1 Tax=Homarus americanus TaxID=6706 RepID=UPI001C471884|nr:uncharacterized protein LOC121862343 [Homarus americanus]